MTTFSSAAQRILLAAAELFARHGYSATSTRDIAAAVGVRQPAIYKHFPTKDAILATLIGLAMQFPLRLAERLSGEAAPAAVRLYGWMLGSLEYFHRSPFLLASVLITPEVQQAQFASEQLQFERLEQYVAELVQAGQREGDLRAVSPLSAARLIIALFDALAIPETAVAPVEIADFALTGLLVQPDRLPQIRRQAGTLAAPSD